MAIDSVAMEVLHKWNDAGAEDISAQNSAIPVLKAVYDTCFYPAIRIFLQTKEHSEFQNGIKFLSYILSIAKQEVLSWGGDPGFTTRSLLYVASRILDPDLESSGSIFVESYILQLVLRIPSQMPPHNRDLVSALVRRMQSSKSTGLRSSLLLIYLD